MGPLIVWSYRLYLFSVTVYPVHFLNIDQDANDTTIVTESIT